MQEEFRKYHRLMTFIPAGIHFGEGEPSRGWGRIRNLSLGGVELETHFPVKSGQRLYLSFDIDGFYQFQHVPSRVVRLKNLSGVYSAGLVFDEALDREHLREAMIHLIHRG